ncbi:MAG: sulfite exporter TauE/SafE family protein [Actinomycetota bacterium]
MSTGVYIGVLAVMFVAATVNASTGFGQGLIAAPLFRLLHPELLPVPIVVVGLIVTLKVLRQDTRLSDVRQVVPALAGRVFGIGIALFLLATLSEVGLSVAVGVIVLAFALLRLSGLRIPQTNRSLGGAGVVSGVGGTIAALGGAPMALLYVQHAEARDFRGPIAAYTVIGSSMGLLALIIAGEFDREAFGLVLRLLPAVLLGMVASRWVTPIIDRGYLRPLVLALSGTSALVLIASSLI